jgi:hypothetical protein
LKPFYDFGLDYRCTTAADQSREKAERRLATNPARAGVEQSIKMAHEIVKAANGSLRRAIYDGLAKLREGEIGIEPVEIPLPELKIDAAAPPPLFTTDDDFVTATRKLITSKALDDADADDH